MRDGVRDFGFSGVRLVFIAVENVKMSTIHLCGIQYERMLAKINKFAHFLRLCSTICSVCIFSMAIYRGGVNVHVCVCGVVF